MDKKNTVIFICADETQFGGERDYMKSIAAEITARGQRKDTEYLVYKHASGGAGNAKTLPVTNAEYADAPQLDKTSLADIVKNSAVSIVAVGHSTLDDAIALSGAIAEKNHAQAKTSYITHMVNDRASLQKIVEDGITLFTPASRSDLAGVDKELAARANLVHLDAVPHTNSKISCQIDYETYMKTPSGQAAKEMADSGEAFAFVVLNAGFSVDSRHIPYTAKEALLHGEALGRAMPAGTNLILCHGGPRSIIDEEAAQPAMGVFAKAYMAAQAEREVTPRIIKERYRKDLPYNIIKAGYMLSEKENCIAFISNGEGYGTMDGAVLHVDNGKKLLGMFPFKALYADTTGQRQANIEKYNRLGVAILRAENGRLAIEKHPQQNATPHKTIDAARLIAASLKLVESSAPKTIYRPARPA